MLSPDVVRKDFPILGRKVNGKRLVYFDNASTSHKPRQVIDAISDYYRFHNSNVHRAVHTLSAEATEIYDSSHEKTADFIGAERLEEVVFTKNTTESINIVANHFSGVLKKGDEILLTQMEHHSNLVPWLNAAKLSGARVRYAKIEKTGELDIGHLNDIVTKKTRIVAVTHVSNVLGTINPVKEIADIAHDKGALVLADGAQSVPHMPVNVRKLGCDFLAFSAHKMLGPTGLGVLYGRAALLDSLKPFNFGGDMISEVTFEGAKWNELPWKFEAGTPNMAGAAGMSAAIDYLNRLGMDSVFSHGKGITAYAAKRLEEIGGIEVYGPPLSRKGAVISFNLRGVHPHDVSSILDSEGVAIRGGHHCAMPLMGLLGVSGTSRASFYVYNTKGEVDIFIEALKKVAGVMLK
ncbi:cysteine desulfurase [Candidatus Woesearchaeota archaeon]|nr:cysteine desulfurase [Candidatus Woesearchaeota archaeon]